MYHINPEPSSKGGMGFEGLALGKNLLTHLLVFLKLSITVLSLSKEVSKLDISWGDVNITFVFGKLRFFLIDHKINTILSAGFLSTLVLPEFQYFGDSTPKSIYRSWKSFSTLNNYSKNQCHLLYPPFIASPPLIPIELNCRYIQEDSSAAFRAILNFLLTKRFSSLFWIFFLFFQQDDQGTDSRKGIRPSSSNLQSAFSNDSLTCRFAGCKNSHNSSSRKRKIPKCRYKVFFKIEDLMYSIFIIKTTIQLLYQVFNFTVCVEKLSFIIEFTAFPR